MRELTLCALIVAGCSGQVGDPVQPGGAASHVPMPIFETSSYAMTLEPAGAPGRSRRPMAAAS